MHAYVILSKGGAPAERSLLLNYTGGRFSTMRKSFLNGHFLVFFSSVIVLTAGMLSTIASGVLTSRGSPVDVPNVPIQSTKSLGLVSDITSLQTFLAASGYAAASASARNLTDPPFILGSWAVAQFVVPPPTGAGTNGTIIVPTTGIQTMSNCGPAFSQSATLANGQWTLQATWHSCTISLTTPAQGSEDLFGVEPVPSCTENQQQSPSFQPVLFWFLSGDTQGLSMTFCQPSGIAYNVLAEADLSTGLLTSVSVVDNNVAQNNFTGPPFNGQVLNGVYFGQTNDRFVNARSVAVQTALPDAIYRATRGFPGGLGAMIAQDNGADLTDLTNKTYTQFLSFAAQQSYFFDSVTTINSSQRNWELRLWVYPIAAHSFAAALVLIGLIAAWVHTMHMKARRNVYLSCDPSTMAATLSMTSESGFPRLLKAGDEDAAMGRSLKGLRFGISRRTWQVVAEGEEEGTLSFGIGSAGAGQTRDVRLSSLGSSMGTPTPGSTQTVFDAGDHQGLLAGAAPYGRRESHVDPFTTPGASRSHSLWLRIAQRSIQENDLVWPAWALPLPAIPASTIEDLLLRALRFPSLVCKYYDEIEIRDTFEGVIQRPWDSPMWLHLIRGRWLLLQLSDFTLELWDLDEVEYTHPAATFVGLEGFVNGVVHTEEVDGVEIILSTSLFRAYKFSPDLPFRKEMRAVQPALIPTDCFHGYSSVKARKGRLLAFAGSAGDPLRACIMYESTHRNVELAFGNQVFEYQRTLDICMREDVLFVARHRNMELYLSTDVKHALEISGTTDRGVSPFQSFSYPGEPLLHSPQFHSATPVYFNAPDGSVALAHFVDDEWQAIVVSPQLHSSNPKHRDYKIENVHSIGSAPGALYGTRTGENGYRCTALFGSCLTLHYGKPWDVQQSPAPGAGFSERGPNRSHTLVSWKIPDSEIDLPRPNCVAIDEAVGICIAGMGSGRIWIGDAVPGAKPKRFDLAPLPGRMPHPDPRWPLLPPSYFWDTFHPGPLSPSDPVDEVVPGWSTAVDHYWPWRNNPEAYGGILWFVEHFMGIPGPARSCLFRAKALFEKSGPFGLPILEEFVDVNGRIFRINTDTEWITVRRFVDGITIEDIIDCLKDNRVHQLTSHDEDWMSDYMAIYQHMHWYRIFRHPKS
ncbi:hypothetical protein FRC01_007404 [Tulasnella sp. 417]|nr:hypothetical protein FRC01_007404 [Tulasnella sp. 417]